MQDREAQGIYLRKLQDSQLYGRVEILAGSPLVGTILNLGFKKRSEVVETVFEVYLSLFFFFNRYSPEVSLEVEIASVLFLISIIH